MKNAESNNGGQIIKSGSEDDDPGGLANKPAKDNSSKNISPIKKMKNKIARAFGMRTSASLEEEVADFIEEYDPEGTQVSSEERSILSNVLRLGDIKVSDVMIPRTDIVAVEDNISITALKKVIETREHTRIPVYKESLDKVIGFVHIKDLISFLGSKKPFNINNLIREILYIPPSMKVLDLLMKMRAKRVHMALVLDEYGGTDGLVTMEDLMEEIVGEIEDEHDAIEKSSIKAVADDIFEINARMPVEELEEKFNVKLKSGDEAEEFDTVGGLIFYLLGRVPDSGEVIDHPAGVQFTVAEADLRRIKKLHVKKL